jgi:HSP90 family molecular chaperone
VTKNVSEYKDYKLADVSKEGLKFDEEDEEERKKKEEELEVTHKKVKDYLETALAGKVQKVKMTDQLTDSPAALVQSAYGMSPTMQRYMKAQNVASGGADAGMMGSFNQAVLEVNPAHPVVRDLARMVEAGSDVDGEGPANFASLLYDVAALTSGYDIEDAADFAGRFLSMMSGRVGGEVADAEVVKNSAGDSVEAAAAPELSGAQKDFFGVKEAAAVETVAEAPAAPELTAAQKDFFVQ